MRVSPDHRSRPGPAASAARRSSRHSDQWAAGRAYLATDALGARGGRLAALSADTFAQLDRVLRAPGAAVTRST
jgi:hypothetical protein